VVESTRPVTRREREALLRQAGTVLWLSGLPEAALLPLARALERRLVRSGFLAYVVSPEEFGWSCPFAFHQKLGASGIAHLACNAAGLAGVLADAGLIAILPLSTLSAAERQSARLAAPPGRFLEITFESGTNRPASAALARDREGRALKLSADHPEQALDVLMRFLKESQSFRPWDSAEFEI
jgi:adenylylsulfate kinase-like enzyme